jgi:hypothetical protein
LSRSGALPPERITALNNTIARVEASRTNRREAAQLQAMADSLDKEAGTAKTPADGERMRALASVIKKTTAMRN